MKKTTMLSKRTLAILISASMAVSAMPLNVFAANTPSDIQGHWAQATIEKWIAENRISGYSDGTIKPDAEITVAEFLTMLDKAGLIKNSENSKDVDFDDVAGNEWYSAVIKKAVNAGIAAGISPKHFGANDTISRVRAAAFLAKALGLEYVQPEGIKDASELPAWGAGAIGALLKAGAFSGYGDNTIRGNKPMSRAEALTLIDKSKNESATPATPVTPTTPAQVTALTESNLKDQTVDGNLVIPADNKNDTITIKDTTVKGDLIIRSGSKVVLDNVKVEGNIIVEGNGTVVIDNNTTAGGTTLGAGSKITAGKDFAGDIGDITVKGSLGSTTTIDVPDSNVNVETPSSVNLTEDTKKLTVGTQAKGSKIEINTGKVLDTLEANAGCDITGSGTINNLNSNAGGVSYGPYTKINNTNTKDGTGAPTKESTGGGGGAPSSTTSSNAGSNVIKTLDEFIAAIKKGGVITLAPGADFREYSIDAETDAENITINFGTARISNFKLSAPNAKTMTFNDAALDYDNGASIDYLNLNAPNAVFVDNVYEYGPEINAASSKFMDYADNVYLYGGNLYVAPHKDYTQTGGIHIRTEDSITLSGQIDKLLYGSMKKNENLDNAEIGEISTASDMTLNGSGHVSKIYVQSNDVTITINDDVIVDEIIVIDGTTGTVINGTSANKPSEIKKKVQTHEYAHCNGIQIFNYGQVNCDNRGTATITMDEVAGEDIYYTTDGTTPTSSSTKYDGGKIVIHGLDMDFDDVETFNAISVKDGYVDSDVFTFSILFNGIHTALPEFLNSFTSKYSYNLNQKATALDATANVTDGGTITYQWYRYMSNTSDILITGATSPLFTPPTDAIGTKHYYCIASNSNPSVSDNEGTSVTPVFDILVGEPSLGNVLSNASGNINEDSNIDINVTSSLNGEVFYALVDKGASVPSLADTDSWNFIDSAQKGENVYTISKPDFESDIYLILTTSNGNYSNPCKISIAPNISVESISRFEDSATLLISSDISGMLYYSTVEKGAARPAIDTSTGGTALVEGVNYLTVEGLDASKEYDAYVVGKSSDGSVGTPVKAEVSKWYEFKEAVDAEAEKLESDNIILIENTVAVGENVTNTVMQWNSARDESISAVITAVGDDGKLALNNGTVTLAKQTPHGTDLSNSFTKVVVTLSKGNYSVTKEISVEIYPQNNALVGVQPYPTATLKAGTSQTFKLDDLFTDADGDTINVNNVNLVDESIATAVYDAATRTINVTGLKKGTTQVQIMCDDGYAGNVECINVVVENSAPVAKSPVPSIELKDNELDSDHTLALNADDYVTDADGDPLTISGYAFDENQKIFSISNDVITGTTPGAETLTITVSDGNDDLSVDVPVNVTHVNHAPVAKTIAAQSISAMGGAPLQFTGADLAVDPDGDSVSILRCTSEDYTIADIIQDEDNIEIIPGTGNTDGVTIIYVTVEDAEGASTIVEIDVNVYGFYIP